MLPETALRYRKPEDRESHTVYKRYSQENPHLTDKIKNYNMRFHGFKSFTDPRRRDTMEKPVRTPLSINGNAHQPADKRRRSCSQASCIHESGRICDNCRYDSEYNCDNCGQTKNRSEGSEGCACIEEGVRCKLPTPSSERRQMFNEHYNPHHVEKRTTVPTDSRYGPNRLMENTGVEMIPADRNTGHPSPQNVGGPGGSSVKGLTRSNTASNLLEDRHNNRAPYPASLRMMQKNPKDTAKLDQRLDRQYSVDKSPTAGSGGVGSPKNAMMTNIFRAFKPVSWNRPSSSTACSLPPTQQCSDGKNNLQISQFYLKKPLLIFDWDDTILPIFYLRKFCEMTDFEDILLGKPVEQLSMSFRNRQWMVEMEPYIKLVIEFLKNCLQIGQVAIITLSKSPWVHRSAEIFMPQILPLLNQFKIVYARDMKRTGSLLSLDRQIGGAAPMTAARLRGLVTPPQQQQQQKDLSLVFIELKQASFDHIFRHYAVGPSDPNYNRTIPTVISLGDSWIEREACRIATGHVKTIYSKTIKFLHNPSLEELHYQIYKVAQVIGQLTYQTTSSNLALEEIESQEHGHLFDKSTRKEPPKYRICQDPDIHLPQIALE